MDEMVYLSLDARYEKAQQDGQFSDATMLLAAGVDRKWCYQVCESPVRLENKKSIGEPFCRAWFSAVCEASI
jgi:hypothetical protein